MAGKTSEALLYAIELAMRGNTPYRAAIRAGIHLSTIYRSPLYKAWRDGLDHPELTKLKEKLRPVKKNRVKR